MIIKKYYGETETQAIILAKEELGKAAIVTNIKKIEPNGIFKLFRKPKVEVTAAIDDVMVNVSKKQEQDLEKDSVIEKRLSHLQNLLEEQTYVKRVEENPTNYIVKKPEVKSVKDSKSPSNENAHEEENEYSQIIYNQLIENEVDKTLADQIFREVKIGKNYSLDQALAAIYQKIILKLGQPKTIQIEENNTRFVFFIGPTGVGKTTTIAKIASHLSIHDNAKVMLLTLDTYRIAAVEQLRTYANILNIPLQVIYSVQELEKIKDELEDYDIVLIDTAGMSHKNKEQQNELETFINTIEEEKREIYLVLSLTTKYKDLVKIEENYSKIVKYRLLFTKLDETSNIGGILNLKMLSNACLSYITLGQNVPDDICKLDTQSIAKQLLGGID